MTIFVCYLSTYGMWKMAELTNQIESELHHSEEIITYHDTIVRCFRSNKGFWKIFTIFAILLVNYSVVVACSVQLANFFNDIFNTNTIYIKLVIYAVCMVIIIFALEPEKMKYFAMGSTFLIFLFYLICYADNMIKCFPEQYDFSRTRDLAVLSNTGTFLGVGTYAYEAVGSLYTIRRSMQKPRLLPKLIVLVFVFIGTTFMLGGFGYYTVYGNEAAQPMIFSYYPKGGNFMYVLVCIVNVSIGSFIPFYIIANMEILENFESIKNWLYYEDQTTNRWKLSVLRLAGTVVAMGCSMVSDDVEVVTGFAGAVFMPLISFLLPILAFQNRQWSQYSENMNEKKLVTPDETMGKKKLYKKKNKNPNKCSMILWSIHDGTIFVIGIA